MQAEGGFAVSRFWPGTVGDTARRSPGNPRDTQAPGRGSATTGVALCGSWAVLLVLLGGFCQFARADSADVQTAWRLLDYIAVDYAGAVEHGQVVSAIEYAEQNEFAQTIATRIAALPPQPEQAQLLADVARLQAAIAGKADVAQVAGIARGVGAALLVAYPVPVAPIRVPDLVRGAALFQQECASCHGRGGDGDGPAAAGLPVRPIAFTNVERARQRSLFALFQTTTQGIDGTAMPSFEHLSGDDRWALAFHIGGLAFSEQQAAEGARLWDEDSSLHRQVADLRALVQMTPATLESTLGAATADAVIAYLRHHPGMVAPRTGTSLLSLARSRLAESLAAYRAGDFRRADVLALSAYLDGFEPLEPVLSARDSKLLGSVETGMSGYRAALQRREDVGELVRRAADLDHLLEAAEVSLADGASSQMASFLGAATILLREGLEALLIIVGMIVFLRKAERTEIMPYVHAGWLGALLAGVLTWAAATWLIQISGASRELTEGFGSVFAAVVLVSVGIWMHGKAHGDEWQRYIREKMSRAMSGRSAWLLFVLAFVVVYREVFETILFFAALWAQGNAMAMLAGAATAGVALVLIGWLMLNYSRRLPLNKFFTYSAWLMAVLAVILIGKGVAALQEAGLVGIAPLTGLPRVTALGLFPTWQTITAQVLTALALLAGFAWNRRKLG